MNLTPQSVASIALIALVVAVIGLEAYTVLFAGGSLNVVKDLALMFAGALIRSAFPVGAPPSDGVN